ncbi:helix-turn-helix domain-containing protein [Paenibacillus sepulcri]|uniref:Helix-turn-helix domain-containing protein n=2 Tax=Paenibacillus sepulcri TaxID=359917 RepID=A0ABS7BWU5_9BACL|nr:helix-turn-helix domain-containing protein [Paenibacillus sepulcri]
MNWNYFKSKLLLNYALSYILIFLIPLTGVTIFVYKNAVDNLRSEIEQSNVNQLNQVRMNIDARMAELQETASRISFDVHLTPYMVRHPYYSKEAIDTLANYKANSQILDNLFLYYHDDSVIYSSEGMTDVGTIFRQKYKFADWPAAQVLQDLNNAEHPLMRPAGQVIVNSRQESMLALLVPIKPNDPYPYGTVVYLMEEEKLTGVMDSILNKFSGNSYIFDDQGRVLTKNRRGEAIPGNELSVLSSLDAGIHSLMLDGKQQSVVAVQSEENGWTYVTTMPSSQFFSRIFHIQTLILLVFFIVALTGITAAVMLAKRQYHPVKDLMEFTRLKTGSRTSDSAKSTSEWDWIRQTIHDYSARIQFQEPYARTQFLMMLLKHGSPNDHDLEQLIKSVGLELPGTQGEYWVMLLKWDAFSGTSTAGPDRRDIHQLLHDLDMPQLKARAYGIDFSPADQFAVMISLAPDAARSSQDRIEEIVDHIRGSILQRSSLQPSIGVGSPYGNLGELNQSFIEAATALEFRMLGELGSVTYFEKLSAPESETFWISKKSLLKLEQSLKQGNETVAFQMIQSIIADLRTQTLSAALMRCICFDVLNALLKNASELGMNGIIHDIPNLTAFETLEELERKLEALAAQICGQVERQAEIQQHSLLDDIVSYVDRQYADYTLSLEHLALKFSISASYLSRSFKDKTGSTFSQYIWRLRMEEVMRLLVSSDAPLKDVIEQVGYLDTPNFIRKFKKETGYTPGQYRKLRTGEDG